MLFNKLPDDLFTPLSGQNRHIYQSVLLALADQFFDEDLIDPFIPRDQVRSCIEESVVRQGVRRWVPEGDDSDEQPRSASEYASRIYRRLVDTGWLEEEQRIYRTFVLLSPSVSFLLRTLVSIANLEKRSYGGAVLNVLSSLEAALNDPVGRGLTLAEAAQTAADFSAHLTDMMLGLRELKISLAQSSDAREIVRNFFEHFVEHILVSDYKTLKTRNNPFRYRRQILALLRDLQFDPLKLEQLIAHYQEQFDIEQVDAEAMVYQHINRIIRIFESVDQRLATIDDFRYRLEKRVADTVRYMDKTTPGMAARLSRAISNLNGRADEAVPRIDTLDRIRFMSPGSVRSPVKRRVIAEPKVIRKSEIDPEVLMLRELFKEYKARREVTPKKIGDFIERQLRGRKKIEAKDFEINSIEDYICFSYVRHMATLGKQGRKTADRYEVRFRDNYIQVADVVECRDFVIQRTQ
ncbi:MAG: DUF5716 family protein [Marinobacterium sp.]|nr:DUF5716 family protein [Marinobacterium sp.]